MGWIPVLAVCLGWGLAQLPLLNRLDLVLNDAQQRLASREHYFRDAVVLDIDEISLSTLQPLLGNWPYSRDVYALVLDYLAEQGARAVVFDIVLADVRAKDETFAAALRRNGNGVLVATTPAPGHPAGQSNDRLLDMAAWHAAPDLPRQSWPAMLMPNPVLLEGAPRTPVGVVTAVTDSDGYLRRLPLLHEVEGRVLPSVLLAAAGPFDAPRRVIRQDGGTWQVGHASWPVDPEGFLHVYYPSNANSVLSMPFHAVARTAMGAAPPSTAAGFFSGKTVFLGSTAFLSDRVVTPRGPMSGTYALAITHQAMMAGLVLRPEQVSVNMLLLGLAGAAVFILVGVPGAGRQQGLFWLFGSALGACGVHLLLLMTGMQKSALVPVLLALVLGWLLHLVEERRWLSSRARQLEAEADLDSLTGLPVRRALLRAFKREMSASSRYGRPLSVAILDLDHFKRVNDTYGHPMGDEVLKRFAGVLRENLRQSDSIGRWGGEEFVVLLPETPLEGAVVLLDKVRLAIGAEHFPPPAEALGVTMSAGVTSFDGQEVDPEAIVGYADQALYEAKESGRNRVIARPSPPGATSDRKLPPPAGGSA